LSLDDWKLANEGLQIWAEKHKIKTRIQYYCGVCGSFVSKDTLNCKACKKHQDEN